MVPAPIAAPVGWVAAVLDRWNATRPGRAAKRFGDANGGVLGAGIAYYAVFSIFPTLAVGFTAFAAFLGGREDLQGDLVEWVNRVFGFEMIGLTDDDGGVVSVDALIQSTAVGVTALLGVAVLVWTGLGWLSATRQGVRAVFGQPPGQNFVVGKLLDLLTLTVLGVLVLASVTASVLVSTFSGVVLDWLGVEGALASVTVTALSAFGLLLVDFVILVLFFRLLAGVRLPLADLVPGAVAGAFGLGLLTLGGGLLLRAASRNQFLATFGAVVVLLLWANLAARVTLVAAAWCAVVATDRGHLAQAGAPGADAAEPVGPAPAAAAGPVAGSVAGSVGGRAAGGAALRPVGVVGTPDYGVRSADRVTLAAGALLGLGAVLAGRVVSGAVRSVRDAWR